MSDRRVVDYTDLPIRESFEYGTAYEVDDEFDPKNIHMSVIRFDPGEEGPLSYHHEPVEEFYYVAEGKLDIQLDDQVYTAKAGSVAHVPAGTAHRPINKYDKPAILLSISSPNVDDLSALSTSVDNPLE
jgi:quercetin dioxygenase-like cupin family protein